MIARTKLHFLNRKLHKVSELCTKKLQFLPPDHWKSKNNVGLNVVERTYLYELEELCNEIREACKDDK